MKDRMIVDELLLSFVPSEEPDGSNLVGLGEEKLRELCLHYMKLSRMWKRNCQEEYRLRCLEEFKKR